MEADKIQPVTTRVDIEEQMAPSLVPDLASPPEGKVWRRKSDGVIFYGEMYLGEIHFVNGKKLKTPIKEKVEDFELVDIII